MCYFCTTDTPSSGIHCWYFDLFLVGIASFCQLFLKTQTTITYQNNEDIIFFNTFDTGYLVVFSSFFILNFFFPTVLASALTYNRSNIEINGSATVKIYPIFVLASIHWINPIHFFGNMLSFVCFIYVIDVFLVDHCHLIPLLQLGWCCSTPVYSAGGGNQCCNSADCCGYLISIHRLHYFKMSYF